MATKHLLLIQDFNIASQTDVNSENLFTAEFISGTIDCFLMKLFKKRIFECNFIGTKGGETTNKK